MLRLATRHPRLRPPRLIRNHATSTTDLIITDPVLVYQSQVARGLIRNDPEQLRALYHIRNVHQELLDYSPPVHLITLLEGLRSSSDPELGKVPPWPFKRSSLSNLPDLSPEDIVQREALLNLTEQEKSRALVRVLKDSEGLENLSTPKGFLLTGPPGTGKSLLMDIFFDSLPVKHKVRFHYHAFLLWLYSAVHQALEKQRFENEAEERLMNELAAAGNGEGYPWSRREEQKALALTKGWRSVFAGGRSADDPALNTREFVLAGVARDLIKTHGWLLAFDEVQLLDIAGAGMVARVLSWYWRLGGVTIATSNRVPQDLYNQGVQRESFSPFLSALSARSPVYEIRSPLDYRREQRSRDLLDPSLNREPGDYGQIEAWKRWGSRAKGWFVRGEEASFKDALHRIVGDLEGETTALKVYGRKLVIPWTTGGVARFTFSQLCETALGPADYITIASTYHTVILTDVPVLPLSAKNEARRLITLLDALYEARTRIIVSAEVDVDELFFPDAVKLASIVNSSAATPPSTGRVFDDEPSPIRHAVDPAGEISDALTEEMLGDVAMDLEAPYRPNVSSYDQSALTDIFSRDAARVDKPISSPPPPSPTTHRPLPHPSAATPAFQSLAIFTGEEERFAFKRAVSRVHEMSSAEYLVSTVHAPLDASVRTWERPANSPSLPPLPPARPARHSIGPKALIEEDHNQLSGVLSPSNLRVRFPDGLPVHPQVEVKRDAKPRRGEKPDVINMENDTRGQVSPPVLKNDHVWGVREDWGKGAGAWGKGASVHEKEKK